MVEVGSKVPAKFRIVSGSRRRIGMVKNSNLGAPNAWAWFSFAAAQTQQR
jgi:hypothetical protein